MSVSALAMASDAAERRGVAAGLRWAATYLVGGACVNLDGIEERLTVEEFQTMLMTTLQMFSEQLEKQASRFDAGPSA